MEELEILKKYSRFFEHDKMFFELLKSMSFDKLNIPNNNSIILTPLLEEICKYAMILPSFNELELNTIRCIYGNNQAFGNLMEVVNSSFDYACDALDNECFHPTILTFNSLLNGSDIYNTMMEFVYDNYLMFGDGDLKGIFDVDKCVTETEDEITKSLMKDMNEFDKSIYELADALKRASVERARNKMLMDRYITYSTTINGRDIQIKASDGTTKDLYNNVLSDIFKEVRHNHYMNKLDKYYKLYKLYQYNYLTNSDKHIKLLEKCKQL